MIPEQCRFWPAVVSPARIPDRSDRQMAHRNRCRLGPRLGLSDRLEPAETSGQCRQLLRPAGAGLQRPGADRRRLLDRQLHRLGRPLHPRREPRSRQALVPVALLRRHSRPHHSRAAAQGRVCQSDRPSRRRASSGRGRASRAIWNGPRPGSREKTANPFSSNGNKTYSQWLQQVNECMAGRG